MSSIGGLRAIDELAEEIVSLVYELAHRWDAYFDAKVKQMDAGVTGRQALVLWMAGGETQLSMGELARVLRMDPSSATGLVERLEAKGLATRVADPGDRRGTLIFLTPAGKKLRSKVEDGLVSARPSIEGMTQRDKRVLRDLLKSALNGLPD